MITSVVQQRGMNCSNGGCCAAYDRITLSAVDPFLDLPEPFLQDASPALNGIMHASPIDPESMTPTRPTEFAVPGPGVRRFKLAFFEA
jgi:hypothetical protein